MAEQVVDVVTLPTLFCSIGLGCSCMRWVMVRWTLSRKPAMRRITAGESEAS
jgi:hypothetical protein